MYKAQAITNYKHKGRTVELKTSDVIKICLTCPLPKCGDPLSCQRYKNEIKKLKENA